MEHALSRWHRMVVCVLLLAARAPSGLGGEATAQAPAHAITADRVEVRLGQTRVEIVTHRAEAPGLTYVNLHDDENTAVEAALATIRAHGGRLVEIRHTGARNLSFELGGAVYTFDPNRIFTDEGARASLEAHGPVTRTALSLTRGFARALLQRLDLDAAPPVVTVHNNTEGQYSALSYGKGGAYEQAARSVHRVEGSDPDDFFFVTSPALYAVLRAGGYNVVLQDNERVADDGSLSVYCGQQGIAYVNVEAQHGHRAAQIRMLNYLNEALRDGGLLQDTSRLQDTSWLWQDHWSFVTGHGFFSCTSDKAKTRLASRQREGICNSGNSEDCCCCSRKKVSFIIHPGC